ncbi:MAG: transcriptional regulator [Thermoprotei archaeon]|nr:MAG: transcriptional regulator [Thermoprotei archaeon]
MKNFESRRERIIDVLKNSDRPLNIDEIAALIGLNPRESKSLYEDLRHAAKTLYRKSKGREYIAMIPPRCINCGFVFKNLNKLRKPSKCPKCKSERIIPPSFMYVEE